MGGQQLNTDSEKLAGSWDMIEIDSVGCVPTFGGASMAADELGWLGRELGERG